MSVPPIKAGLHARNRFRAGYDFESLITCSPALSGFVAPNAHGDISINFADPGAVKALNQALLKHAYGLDSWDIPQGSLCPPIPGRSDYLHNLADLLSAGEEPAIPRGRSVAVLDIGMGANCVYPLIGASEYGWRFVGTEVDPVAWRWATNLVAAHPSVADRIECRKQASQELCFEGVVESGEAFDLSMCNPPFYASQEEAAEGNQRKRRNLGRDPARRRGRRRSGGRGPETLAESTRNFGGQAGELWCPGGELGFVQRLIAQSAQRPQLCRWFTTLISKSAHLTRLHKALDRAGATEAKTLDMAQGQKKSRILAWTFVGTR